MARDTMYQCFNALHPHHRPFLRNANDHRDSFCRPVPEAARTDRGKPRAEAAVRIGAHGTRLRDHSLQA